MDFIPWVCQLGAGFAGLSGAAVLMLAESVDLFNLPIIGEISRWQLAFIIVGLPGILLAFLIAALKEPQRTSNKNQNAEEEIKITEALKFFIEKRSALGSFILPACVMTIIAYSHAWLAPMFERTWDMPPSTYAFINGLLLLVFGPLSNNSAGWLADRLVKQGKKDGGLRVVILGAFIFLPTAILAPLVPNPTLCFIMLSINTIGIAFTSSSALIALVRIVPSKIRGLSTAILLNVH